MDVIILTIGFRPNSGGLETHLSDLTEELSKKYEVLVVTLSPLTTNVKASRFEKNGKLIIWRVPWYGGGLFYKLLKYPVLEFFYLTPPLVVGLTSALIKYPEIKVIHAQGLSGVVVGGVIGKLFRKRVVVSTHFVYHFRNNFFSRFAKWAYDSADRILCVSLESGREMKRVGISKAKIGICAYWVDPKKFKPENKQNSKRAVGWTNKFAVLFVGRLVKDKGVIELLKSTKKLNNGMQLYIIGDGPLKKKVEDFSREMKNVKYIGRVDNNKIPIYYSAADVVVVPSYEETLGRVGMEALSCGTPVIATDRGGIREVISERVGLLVKLSPENIAASINKLYTDKKLYVRLKRHSRKHVLSKYSPKNINVFIDEYGI